MTEAETLKLKAQARRRRAEAENAEPEALPAMDFVKNLPSSMYRTGANLVDAAIHPVRTFESMADLTGGMLRKIPEMRPQWLQDTAQALQDSPITRALGQQSQETPEDFARQDATGDAFDQMLEERWSTPTRAWNTVVENPADALLTLAPALGAAGKVAQVSKLPRVASTLDKAAEFTNPVNLIKKPVAAVADRYAPRVPGLPRMTSALLRNAAPDNLADFDALGPEAMVLDASPSTVGLAQGVTVAPGPAKNLITGKLTKRDRRRSDRLLKDVQKSIGGAYDPNLLKTSIDRGSRKKAAPQYRNAKDNAQPLPPGTVQKLARGLTEPSKSRSLENRGSTMSIMDQVEDALMAETPKQTVNRLHDIRKNIDAKLQGEPTTSADKASRAVLQQARKVIDKTLKENYPGFRRGDEIIAAGKKAQEDIDFGGDVLAGGDSAMTPEMLDKQLKGRDPRMVREGVKAKIANATGTRSNDLAAIKKMIGGDNDWNRAKLSKVFSGKAVDDLVAGVDRESTFGQNSSDILRNSQTAQRNAAAAQTGELKLPEMSSSATITGTIGSTLSKAVNKLLSKGASKISDTNNRALTEALMLSGPQARALFAILKNPPKRRGVNDTAMIKALIAGNAAGALEHPRGRQ
ncbi:MAG: hypothetical protein ABL936_00420 [Aestuariivirga sp.]